MLGTTLLCWRAMVRAVHVRHERMRNAADHTARELAAFARRRARLPAPAAAQAQLARDIGFLRRHLHR